MPPRSVKSSSATDGGEGDAAGGSKDDPFDRFESLLTKITLTMQESFNKCFDKLISSLEEKLTLKIDVQASEMFVASQKTSALETKVAELQKENNNLRDSVKLLTTRLDKMQASMDDTEQYSRIDNLLIHGIPLPSDNAKEGDLSAQVVETLNKLIPGLHINPQSISVAHRLPVRKQPSTTTTPTRPRPPAVVVRFTQRSVKSEVLSKRRALKGTSVSITEHLTTRRADLLKKGAELEGQGKVAGSWSQDGKVLIKALDGKTFQIGSEIDLVQFQG